MSVLRRRDDAWGLADGNNKLILIQHLRPRRLVRTTPLLTARAAHACEHRITSSEEPQRASRQRTRTARQCGHIQEHVPQYVWLRAHAHMHGSCMPVCICTCWVCQHPASKPHATRPCLGPGRDAAPEWARRLQPAGCRAWRAAAGRPRAAAAATASQPPLARRGARAPRSRPRPSTTRPAAHTGSNSRHRHGAMLRQSRR